MSHTESRIVSVERLIEAPPGPIFDVLRSPGRHAELDGSGMVRGKPKGPDPLGPGDSFTMAMHQGPFVYRSISRVVEYRDNELITWRSGGEFRGRTVIGGQWWRYELNPRSADRTLVRHSYLWGKAVLALLTIRLPGYPRRMAATMPATLERLATAVEST